MTPQLKVTLKKALRQLEMERGNLDKQIRAIQEVLGISDGAKIVRISGIKRGRMSAAARKQVSLRMKKYWSQRRKAEAKAK